MWQDLVDQLPSSRPDAHIIAEAARLQNVPLSAQMLQDYALEQHGLGQQASRRVISRGWVDGRNEADSPKSLSYPPLSPNLQAHNQQEPPQHCSDGHDGRPCLAPQHYEAHAQRRG